MCEGRLTEYGQPPQSTLNIQDVPMMAAGVIPTAATQVIMTC